ncbi:hypothetical protein BESB_025160 [Besnoitia besnoiti]|uniref:Transmembrane protein n=1 Tax=Besnoitia besnoiti TaxID=94643 RepID=A0A2A9M845_BESBE|nr:uncharacterized protein BESB_025160 [Besnoitia besnoiti]PFH31550.1 hypothetical protein BESB_025160 [Besnoitia besnoiti]
MTKQPRKDPPSGKYALVSEVSGLAKAITLCKRRPSQAPCKSPAIARFPLPSSEPCQSQCGALRRRRRLSAAGLHLRRFFPLCLATVCFVFAGTLPSLVSVAHGDGLPFLPEDRRNPLALVTPGAPPTADVNYESRKDGAEASPRLKRWQIPNKRESTSRDEPQVTLNPTSNGARRLSTETGHEEATNASAWDMSSLPPFQAETPRSPASRSTFASWSSTGPLSVVYGSVLSSSLGSLIPGMEAREEELRRGRIRAQGFILSEPAALQINPKEAAEQLNRAKQTATAIAMRHEQAHLRAETDASGSRTVREDESGGTNGGEKRSTFAQKQDEESEADEGSSGATQPTEEEPHLPWFERPFMSLAASAAQAALAAAAAAVRGELSLGTDDLSAPPSPVTPSLSSASWGGNGEKAAGPSRPGPGSASTLETVNEKVEEVLHHVVDMLTGGSRSRSSSGAPSHPPKPASALGAERTSGGAPHAGNALASVERNSDTKKRHDEGEVSRTRSDDDADENDVKVMDETSMTAEKAVQSPSASDQTITPSEAAPPSFTRASSPDASKDHSSVIPAEEDAVIDTDGEELLQRAHDLTKAVAEEPSNRRRTKRTSSSTDAGRRRGPKEGHNTAEEAASRHKYASSSRSSESWLGSKIFAEAPSERTQTPERQAGGPSSRLPRGERRLPDSSPERPEKDALRQAGEALRDDFPVWKGGGAAAFRVLSRHGVKTLNALAPASNKTAPNASPDEAESREARRALSGRNSRDPPADGSTERGRQIDRPDRKHGPRGVGDASGTITLPEEETKRRRDSSSSWTSAEGATD